MRDVPYNTTRARSIARQISDVKVTIHHFESFVLLYSNEMSRKWGSDFCCTTLLMLITHFVSSSDKFDQFWTINRRLMERTNEEPFRSIPLRIYQVKFSESSIVCFLTMFSILPASVCTLTRVTSLLVTFPIG